MKTVIGMFDNVNEAQRSLEDLMNFGVGPNAISVVTKRLATTRSGNGLNLSAVDAKDTGPLNARGPLATMLARDHLLLTSLQSAGVSPALAEHYVKAVRDGETLEFVLVDDKNADKVVEIMRRHAARYGEETNGHRTDTNLGARENIGAKEKAQTAGAGVLASAAGGIAAAKAAASNTATRAKEAVAERLESRTTKAPAATTSTAADLGSTNPGTTIKETREEREPLRDKAVMSDGERFIPILREELQVGKREVERGEVHVGVHVTERPVSEHITLREEHVEIERRPANRAPRPEELEFRDGEVDMIEHGEEVVISKQVRVVEEVLVRKQVTEHEETINDKLRSTEVDISKKDRSAYASHFASLGLGSNFEEARPAYDFGGKLRGSSGGDWTPDVEQKARDAWESDHPGTWQKYRDAIRYAWSRK